jgi:hypothetical protein
VGAREAAPNGTPVDLHAAPVGATVSTGAASYSRVVSGGCSAPTSAPFEATASRRTRLSSESASSAEMSSPQPGKLSFRLMRLRRARIVSGDTSAAAAESLQPGIGVRNESVDLASVLDASRRADLDHQSARDRASLEGAHEIPRGDTPKHGTDPKGQGVSLGERRTPNCSVSMFTEHDEASRYGRDCSRLRLHGDTERAKR